MWILIELENADLNEHTTYIIILLHAFYFDIQSLYKIVKNFRYKNTFHNANRKVQCEIQF